VSSYFSSTHFRLRNHFFGTYEFSTNFVLQYYPPWVTEPFQNLRIFYEFRSPVLPTLGYGTIFPEPTNFPRNFVLQYYPPWVTEPFFRNLRIYYEFRSPVLRTLGYGTIFSEPTNFLRISYSSITHLGLRNHFSGTYEFP
jgi:hypothetical protein